MNEQATASAPIIDDSFATTHPRRWNQRQRKRAAAYLRSENAKYGARPREIPKADWPGNLLLQAAGGSGTRRTAVWRSNEFLIQVYEEAGNVVRLSICRTRLNAAGEWESGIAWELLQQIKRDVGYGDRCAVEIYPKDRDVVNVANMRHLWVMHEGLRFGWKREDPPQTQEEQIEQVQEHAATVDAT
jgi:hypothetical protein